MRKKTHMATRIKQTGLILVLHEKRNSHVCIMVDFPALPLTRGVLRSRLGDGANVVGLHHLYHCGFLKPNKLFSLGVLVGWSNRKVLKTFGNSLQNVSLFLISHHSVTLLDTGLAAEPSMAIYQIWKKPFNYWDENLTYLQLSSYLTPMNSPCRLQEWWTGPTGWRGNVAPQRFLEETVLLLWNRHESNLNFSFLFNSHVRDVGRNLMLTIIPEKSSLSSNHTDRQFKSYWLITWVSQYEAYSSKSHILFPGRCLPSSIARRPCSPLWYLPSSFHLVGLSSFLKVWRLNIEVVKRESMSLTGLAGTPSRVSECLPIEIHIVVLPTKPAS